MTYQKLKDFWINKINALITTNPVDPNKLNEGGDWANKINALEKWQKIDALGKNISKDVYVKAKKTVPKFPFAKGEKDKYDKLLSECFTDLEAEFTDLVNVYKTKIGVDPTDETLATNAEGNNILVDGHTIPKWKHTILQKIPGKTTKLTSIPNGKDLPDLLYENDLYKQITNNTNGLPDLILEGLEGGHRPNRFGFDWRYKVNDAAIQEYKNSKTTITNAETHLGLNPGELSTITTNASYNLNGKTLAQLLIPHTCPPCALTHCPNTHANYDTIKGESAEYQRIHTKLSGKVSDNDLTNLLNSGPSCSHSDYDDIKRALADEKEKLTKQKESFELEKKLAQAEKEKEIINKIITDLGLTTEREREREREH